MSHIDHAAALRDAGMRVTAPRVATLAVVTEHPHADADFIAAQVRERLGAVSKQAVYDVLNALSDARLVRRVRADARRALFEPAGDNHHHLVCRSCGRLEDVPCAVGHAPCLTPSEDHGFELEVADVLYRGLCSNCQSARAAEADAISA